MKHETSEHLSFEEIADYVFADTRPPDFIMTAARINQHLRKCEECGAMYRALLELYDRANSYAVAGVEQEKLLTRIWKALSAFEPGKPMEQLARDCLCFREWCSFYINAGRELIGASGFSHPKLVSVMKSADGENDPKEVESVIRTSIMDQDKNRVSIGLDDTLSLYFDALAHSAGQKVLLLPDEPESIPQMAELAEYDGTLTYVRFEDAAPGRYTVWLGAGTEDREQ